MNRPLRMCHVFSSFNPGGPELRTVTIINALGARATHTIVATDGQYQAASGFDTRTNVQIVDPPAGKGSLWYARKLRPVLCAASPDLLLTYNWGAIDAVIANAVAPVAPLIHAEDGFGPEEAVSLKRRRVLTRRLLLPRAYKTVVPSRTLFKIAQREYGLPATKVTFIPNGVDASRFSPELGRGWRHAAGCGDDELLFGCSGALRAEKNLPLLLRAFAQAQLPPARLAIAGDGPCRPELENLASSLGIADRVMFLGHVADPSPYLASLDVFVMSSMTEQMPIALLEAMASALPAICTDVGDSRDILGTDVFPVIVPSDSVERYAVALETMAHNPEDRRARGAANRVRVIQHFSLERMIRAYESLYLEAAGRIQ